MMTFIQSYLEVPVNICYINSIWTIFAQTLFRNLNDKSMRIVFWYEYIIYTPKFVGVLKINKVERYPTSSRT